LKSKGRYFGIEEDEQVLMKKFFLWLSVFPFLPLMLFGQEDGETASMPDVVITATKVEQEVLDVPEHVTVITGEEIEKSGARNLGEVLTARAGVSISDYGPAGLLQTVSMRGSTSNQVLVLIDGIRQNNALNGTVDLSLIPIKNIERIEIVRGGSSALYGADAVGGVINIITKKEAGNRFRITLENGSFIPGNYVSGSGAGKVENPANPLDLFDSQKIVLSFSRDGEKLSLVTTGSVTRADNEYLYRDTNSEDRKRENADLLGWDLYAGFRIPHRTGSVDISASAVQGDRGVPGSITSPTPQSRQADEVYQANLAFFTDRFFSDLLTLNIKTYALYGAIDYAAPALSIDSQHRNYTAGLDLVQEMLFFSALTIVYGGNFSYDRAESSDVGEPERFYGGLFVQTPIYITERFTLQPALRYDYYSDFHGSLNWKLGGNYRTSNTTSLKGSISKSFRAPTFNDLYWPADAFAEGNPDLQPETGYNIDFGVTSIRSSVRYDVFAFFRYVEDVILWQPGPDDIWRPSNYGEAIYPGVETFVSVGFLDHFSISVDYTFLYTFALSGGLTLGDNKRLPNIPAHEIGTRFQYAGEKDKLGLFTQYQSLRYESTANTEFLPSFFVIGASWRHALGKRTNLYLVGTNVFSEEYDLVNLYPMPGISIRTGLEINL
jgi:outer membrane cobalamin receptor